MQKVNQKFVWFEVRNAITPTNGAYTNNVGVYQFETFKQAHECIEEKCTAKGSNYQTEDFQIIQHTETNKTVSKW